WQSATHIRYLVVGLATAMSFLLYMDRFCLSFVERYIKEDLGLSNAQNDWLLAAFFGSYALAPVPSACPRAPFGPRLMLSLYIFLWSLVTGLMGVLVIFAAMLLFRLGCGAAQAGAYPTSGSILSKWVAFSERGVCSSIIALGGRVGGAVVSVTSAYLIVALLPSDASSLLHPQDLLDPAGFREQFRRNDDSKRAAPNAILRELLPPDALESLSEKPTDDKGTE